MRYLHEGGIYTKQNKKFDGSVKELLLSILTGFICFALLVFVLTLFLYTSTATQLKDTAATEIELIKNTLNSYITEDDIEDISEFYKKHYAQLAILLLEGEELSDEMLSSVCEFMGHTGGILIFREDGTPLYTHGDAETDGEFLMRLSEGRLETTDDGHSYVAIPFREDLHLAIEIADLTIEDIQGINIEDSLSDDFIGSFVPPEISSSFVGELMVVDRKSDRLIHAPSSMAGKKLSDFLMPIDDTANDFHYLTVDGSMKLAYYSEYEDYLLLSVFSLEDAVAGKRTLAPALLGSGLLVSLLVAYVQFIRTDMRSGKIKNIHYVKISRKRYINTVLFRKLSAFAMIGITCITVIVYCLQLLMYSDIQRQQAARRLDIAVDVLDGEYEESLISRQIEEEFMVELAGTIQAFLEFKPALVNQKDLSTLARIYDFSGIYVIDEAGKTVASSYGQKSFTVSNDPQDPTYPFWDVINGFSEHYIQFPDSKANAQGLMTAYVGVPDEIGRGMVLLAYPCSESLNGISASSDSITSLRAFSTDSHNMLLAIDPKTGECIFDSSGWYTGQKIDSFGIEEDYLRNGYSGTHMLGNRECQITARASHDLVLLYITTTEWIVFNSWVFTVLVIFVSLLVIILTLLPHLLVRNAGDDIQPLAQKEKGVNKGVHVDITLSDDGEMNATETETERRSLAARWRAKDAGEKLRFLINTLLACTAAYLLLLFFFSSSTASSPLLGHIFERNWDRRLNIYSFSYVVIVLTGIWFIVGILQRITRFVVSSFGLHWKTPGILLSNIIRYTALIISIFFTLQNFGVETSTLVTSASILTLVVGFGSQSLVADLISGIFLIFEGTFRVGDIVTIDNWRGEVIEIGLRATKVKNHLGNVKIFQNSKISGAINMTSNVTYAVCDIPLPLGESLKYIEKKLDPDFFNYAEEHVQGLKNPIRYEGIISMSERSIGTIRISTKCLEIEREQLQRQLYRCFRLWHEKIQAEKAAEAAAAAQDKK